MIVYLVKAYNILVCLVINKDQTRMHLMPMGGDKTCKIKTRKTHPSTWIRRQETNHNHHLIFNQWNVVYLYKMCSKGQATFHSPPWMKEKLVLFLNFIWPIIPTTWTYIGNHQTICWTHPHTLSCNSNGNAYLDKRPKDGLVD